MNCGCFGRLHKKSQSLLKSGHFLRNFYWCEKGRGAGDQIGADSCERFGNSSISVAPSLRGENEGRDHRSHQKRGFRSEDRFDSWFLRLIWPHILAIWEIGEFIPRLHPWQYDLHPVWDLLSHRCNTICCHSSPVATQLCFSVDLFSKNKFLSF